MAPFSAFATTSWSKAPAALARFDCRNNRAAELGLPPLPANGIARVESELLAARPDATARFEWHGAVIHAWRDLLHAGRLREPLPRDWRVAWDGVEPVDAVTLARFLRER